MINLTDNEEIPSTTESVTLFDETEETTTDGGYTESEISETVHNLNHTTSALPMYTDAATTDTTVRISESSSTSSVLITESSSVTTSTSLHSSYGVYIAFFQKECKLKHTFFCMTLMF